MAGAYTCCSSTTEVCARKAGTYGRAQCIRPTTVDTQQICPKCCGGSSRCEGKGQNFLNQNCCAEDETCCPNGDSYICCKTRSQTCDTKSPATSSLFASLFSSSADYGVCTDNFRAVADSNTLCQGDDPLQSPVSGVVLGCGVGTPVCPGNGSYCDTRHVFPDDPYQGACCPAPSLYKNCNVANGCKECANQGCTWVEDGGYCNHVCPSNQLTCVRSASQCTNLVTNFLLGTCWRRCGEVGTLRSKIAGSRGSAVNANQNAFPWQQGGSGQFGQVGGGLTSPFNSPMIGPRKMICSCDYACEILGDCCNDYEEYCLTSSDTVKLG
jgi:hypothetical protein